MRPGVIAVARSSVPAGKFQKLRDIPLARRSSGVASYHRPIVERDSHASAAEDPPTFSM
jgi:hypothetical protein